MLFFELDVTNKQIKNLPRKINKRKNSSDDRSACQYIDSPAGAAVYHQYAGDGLLQHGRYLLCGDAEKQFCQGFWFCVKTSALFLLVISVLGYGFAPRLVSLFRDDSQVIAIGVTALRLQCLTFVFQSWIVMSNMMCQTIGRTAPATFLAMARQEIFFVPLVWLLSAEWGLLGIQMTQVVGDVRTLICAIPIQMKILRELKSVEKL